MDYYNRIIFFGDYDCIRFANPFSIELKIYNTNNIFDASFFQCLIILARLWKRFTSKAFGHAYGYIVELQSISLFFEDFGRCYRLCPTLIKLNFYSEWYVKLKRQLTIIFSLSLLLQDFENIITNIILSNFLDL